MTESKSNTPQKKGSEKRVTSSKKRSPSQSSSKSGAKPKQTRKQTSKKLPIKKKPAVQKAPTTPAPKAARPQSKAVKSTPTAQKAAISASAVKESAPPKQSNQSTRPLAAASAATGSAGSPAKSSANGLTWLALLLGLLGLGAGGYAAWNTSINSQSAKSNASGLDERITLVNTDQVTLKKSFSEVESRVGEAVDTVKKTAGTIETRLQAAEQKIDTSLVDFDQKLINNQSEIETVTAAANSAVENLTGDFVNQVNRWKLEEARSLLAMVNQQFVWSRDPAVAGRGLVLTDDYLAKLEGVELSDVRSALATEITGLQAAEVVDINSLYQKLESLAAQVESLPLAQDRMLRETAEKAAVELEARRTASATEPEPAERKVDWLFSAGKSLMTDIGSMVKVENIDETPTPTMGSEQKFVVVENLRLKVQSAEMALIRSQVSLYQSSLAAAQAWVERYFDGEAAEVKAWSEELANLSSAKLSAELPDISGSLNALDQVIQAGK